MTSHLRPTLRSSGIVIAIAGLILFSAVAGFGQTEQCPYIENPAHREPLSPQLKERMIELCIEDNKKDFERLLERTNELAKLTAEIRESFEKNKKLSKDDKKKLEEAENLVDKIRGELKADYDKDEERKERPKSVAEAIDELSDNTAMLVKEIHKNTRHTISVLAIQSSNKVLAIVKWLRFSN